MSSSTFETRPNRDVRYAKETPMSNLSLSMFDRIGIREDKFGESTDKLDRLF